MIAYSLSISSTPWKRIYFPILLVVFSWIPFVLLAQPVNDKCETATYLPIEVYGTSFYCMEDNIDDATPDPLDVEIFDVSLFPTVWYSFRIFQANASVNIHFRSESIAWPVLRLYKKLSSCNNLVLAVLDFNNLVEPWLEGVDGKAEWIGLDLEYGEYMLAVTSIDATTGTFTLCMNDLSEVQPYHNMLVRTPQVEWREYNGPLDGPYYQGEVLYMSTWVIQRPDAISTCSWFQGLVPLFGQSWSDDTYATFAENSTLNGLPFGQLYNGNFGTSTWDWFEDDVYYNRYSDYLKNGFFEDQLYASTGLKSTLFDPFVGMYAEDIFGGCCHPCWESPTGDRLPPGWFCYGINGNCNIPGPPIRYDWGDGDSCSPSNQSWLFSYSLSVKDEIYHCDSDGDIDLTLAMFPFMDNVVGAWDVEYDGVFDPYGFKRLRVVCDVPAISVNGPDTILHACLPDSLTLHFDDLTHHHSEVAFWKYNFTGPDGNTPFSGFTPLDSLTVFPQNHNQDVIVYSGWLQGFRDPRHLTDQFYVIFKFYKRPPVAQIEWEIQNGLVYFNQTEPANLIDDILWEFGDSLTSNLLAPKHAYNEEGNYTVTLIVSNPCGADTIKETIPVIFNLPSPQFSVSDYAFCPPDTVVYISHSTGFIDSLAWHFEGGDPPFSNDSIVSVVYTDIGVFDVALTAYNILGSPTLALMDSIIVQGPPVAEFVESIADLLLYCVYVGTHTDSLSWQLNFGPIIENDTLIIEAEGKYKVTLIVTNDCGTDTVIKEIQFVINLPKPLFTISDYIVCQMDTIVYTSQSTGSIDSLNWYFEGGEPGFSKDSIVKVVYLDQGIFDISLTVFNALGSANKLIEDSISIEDSPVPTYSIAIYDSLYYCIYKGPSDDDVSWQFGDESIIHNDTLSFLIEKNGTYPVKLWVENSCGRDSIFFDLDIVITAIAEAETESIFLIYPNPAEGSLWLQTDQIQFPGSMRIYDLTGRLVWTQSLNADFKTPFQIHLDQIGISAGTYLLELRQKSRSQIRTFVKM